MGLSVQWTLFNDCGFLLICAKTFVCLFLNSFILIYSKGMIIVETKYCEHNYGQITSKSNNIQVRKASETSWTRQLIISFDSALWLHQVLAAVAGFLCITQDLSLQGAGSAAVAHGLSCPMACGILVPQPGIEPAPPTLEGRFLTTGPPGKSLIVSLAMPFFPVSAQSCWPPSSLLRHRNSVIDCWRTGGKCIQYWHSKMCQQIPFKEYCIFGCRQCSFKVRVHFRHT